MKRHHDRAHRVAEPVQVYLERPDADRLARLTTQLGATKSEVLRRGLAALERAVTDPASHPALRLIGLAEREAAPSEPGREVARRHDDALARDEVASWRRSSRRRKPRGR
ncbi:MAG TPA: hypothetical protein VFP39_11130 [Gemmatimonadales bacterium]|nr:hypothetical protein [Gemmatimonadales bacterium]